ncbi:MAG: hypothetical protein V4466_00760 [Pseudomonadota bacterium]
MKRLGQNLDAAVHDPNDPDPWLALWLDRSLPLDEDAKKALVTGNASYSRSFLLPALRPVIFLLFLVVHLVRRVFVHWPNFNGGLHRLIHWGLRTFGSPQTNLLILRHFHIGTELLAFIKANAGVDGVSSRPLRPTRLKDLEDNVFLQHDLNVFNFVIELNQGLKAQDRELTPVARPDFSMITDGPFAFEPFPDKPWNFADVQTAVEIYTPLYALMLPRHDFVRAVNSLQLDEVIAIYIARILGSDYHMNFIKNGHPLVPLSTFGAGKRLMLHGLDCEGLHGWLRTMKRRQAAGLPLDIRTEVA